MEVGGAAHEDGDELAGASERQPKRSGVWNKFDDAAAAGIFAAARAAGATGAGIRYGEVHYKVWFQPHGEEQGEVTEKIKALQLATANARLEELERRNTSQSTRAQKEKQRKVKQKAAKRAAQTLQQPGKSSEQGAPSESTQQTTNRGEHGRQRTQVEKMSDGEKAAAEAAAYITAASMKHPATSREQRTARLGGKAWQLIVVSNTRAATMDEQQLGRALTGARNEQLRAALLQIARPPSLSIPQGKAACSVSPPGEPAFLQMEVDTAAGQPAGQTQGEDFELYP